VDYRRVVDRLRREFTVPASSFTSAANDGVLHQLPFDDVTDFENAKRGFIADTPNRQIPARAGHVAMDLDTYGFVRGTPAPDTANPSLWRQTQLLGITGLFEVVDGIYQVRNFDLSVMSFIRGKVGWIVVDPLISVETAAEGIRLLREHVEDLPVTAVIATHSHVDHFGGIAGVTSREEVEAGAVRFVAPVGFLEQSVSENVMAGNVMSRRASYMYGNAVPPGPEGSIGAGLGPTTSSGMLSLFPPTDAIDTTPQEMDIDGVRFVFQHTPGAEAPAEFCFYLPEHKALCMAEIVTHTLHNLYTLRGAKVRDALNWSKYINEAMHLFSDADVVFSSHHWPTWGNPPVMDLLREQRDLYRYLHDETLRLANHGYTVDEIAEMIELPAGISGSFANRGYYGSVNHDVKAVYNYYLGWFDGNPANLHPLPPTEAGRKFVEYGGGAEAVVARARDDFAKGEYRWVAEALNNVVFADPDNAEAKDLLADTYEQLGFQAESGPWRNFYLAGATELRNGVKAVAAPSTASPDMVSAMTVPMFLDALAIKLNGKDAADLSGSIGLMVGEDAYHLELSNGTLNHIEGAPTDPDVAVTMTPEALVQFALGSSLDEIMAGGGVTATGDVTVLAGLASHLDSYDFWFNIVTP
jgi:alkyl sulfatase BDS1-like metallo-beta-lactamase superfamily hydrolase